MPLEQTQLYEIGSFNGNHLSVDGARHRRSNTLCKNRCMAKDSKVSVKLTAEQLFSLVLIGLWERC